MEFVRLMDVLLPDRLGARPYQRLVFVKRFRELAEFSIAIGRQLQQFSEKKWLQFVKKWPPLTAYVFRGSLKPTV
jgi:hypothetical protein